jgi:hypothetical protein
MENTITNVTICQSGNAGTYVISGIVNNQPMQAVTVQDEIFEDFNNPQAKMHEMAVIYCEARLEQAYNRLMS